MNAHRTVIGSLAACAASLAAWGCQTPILSLDDAVVMPGEKTRLAAYVEREPLLWLRKDVERVPVRFQIEDQEIGKDKTNDDGLASIERRLDPGTTRYTAWAISGGRQLNAVGRVFTWDSQRVIIAVDVDQTIERTKYKGLILGEKEDESDPVKRSVDVLHGLAADFQIVYLTGRPRCLLEKTRAWLRENEFPDGPVITAKGVRDMLRHAEFKQRKLRELHDEWPNLLIGIGDKPSDADAHGASGLLALAVTSREARAFGPHALVFRSWKELARFFDANRETLTDPRAPRDVIDGKRMLNRPVERYRKR